jgi:hypothetical protein
MKSPRSKDNWYSIRCPDHPELEIGMIQHENSCRFNGGWYCPKCKRHYFYDEKDLQKKLTAGYFPVKKFVDN